jgi:hypothetical protein
MTEALIGAALKAFFASLFDKFFGWLQRQEDDAAQRELGARRQAEAAAIAGQKVEERVREAGNLTVDDVIAGLDAGTI